MTLALLLLMLAPWTNTFERVEHSVVPITTTDPIQIVGSETGIFCTAVVVTENRLITEEHCLRGIKHFMVDGIPAHINVIENQIVLVTADRRGKNWKDVKLRWNPIKPGEPIAVVGYGFGDTKPIITAGIYAGNNYFNTEAIVGQSGGAVVDRDGRLLTLVRSVRCDAPEGFWSPNALLRGGAALGEVRMFILRYLRRT